MKSIVHQGLVVGLVSWPDKELRKGCLVIGPDPITRPYSYYDIILKIFLLFKNSDSQSVSLICFSKWNRGIYFHEKWTTVINEFQNPKVKYPGSRYPQQYHYRKPLCDSLQVQILSVLQGYRDPQFVRIPRRPWYRYNRYRDPKELVTNCTNVLGCLKYFLYFLSPGKGLLEVCNSNRTYSKLCKGCQMSHFEEKD